LSKFYLLYLISALKYDEFKLSAVPTPTGHALGQEVMDELIFVARQKLFQG